MIRNINETGGYKTVQNGINVKEKMENWKKKTKKNKRKEAIQNKNKKKAILHKTERCEIEPYGTKR